MAAVTPHRVAEVAALRVLGYTKETPDPPGGKIARDHAGDPTGVLIAKPNAWLLYSSLAKGPKLDFEDQVNSIRHFMRELNRLGVNSCIDAGGGFQNYPQDYGVVEHLAQRGELTLRIAYSLFTQHPQQEFDDFARWAGMVSPGQGNDVYRMNGAGEMLVLSATDFEDCLEPRPELVSGRTVGGLALCDARNRLSRTTALRLYTEGSAWFSGDEGRKERIAAGQLADLAVLSADYYGVPEEEIKGIESVLTLMGGRVVHGSGEFRYLAPPLPPVSPDWSPWTTFGGSHPHERGGSPAWVHSHDCIPPHALTLVGDCTNWRIGCACSAF